MSLIILNVNEVRRTLSASGGAFVTHDKEVDVVRFAISTGFTDVVLDEHSALRVMYQRPGETEVRAQTLTYYDTDGIRKYYDWELLAADLTEKGTITVALCILRTDSTVEEWHTTPYQIGVLGSIHTDDSDEADETITPTVAQRVAVLETMIQRVASGAPIVVSSVSAMTDTERIYVLTTDGKWYYYDGSAWIAGGEYGGVAVDSVTTDKLANKSVTTAKLDDSSVTWQKLASGAVHTGELADSAVTNVKLADSSVSEEKLASSAVTATKLADGAVATAKIADGAVTTAKIADGTVTAEKIASGVIPAVDTTLAQTGAAADAKKTGDELTDLKSEINNIEPWKAWASKYLAKNGGVGGLGVTASFKENAISIRTAQSTIIGRMIILSNTPRVYGGTQGNFTPLESDLLPIEILESEYIKISSFIKTEDTGTTDRYCTIGIRTFAKNEDDSFTSLAYLNTISSNAKPNTLQTPFIRKIPSGATHFLVAVFFSGGIRERSLEIVYSIEPFNMEAITAATQALVLENIGG